MAGILLYRHHRRRRRQPQHGQRHRLEPSPAGKPQHVSGRCFRLLRSTGVPSLAGRHHHVRLLRQPPSHHQGILAGSEGRGPQMQLI